MMGEESSPLVAVQALGVHHVQWLVDGKHLTANVRCLEAGEGSLELIKVLGNSQTKSDPNRNVYLRCKLPHY